MAAARALTPLLLLLLLAPAPAPSTPRGGGGRRAGGSGAGGEGREEEEEEAEEEAPPRALAQPQNPGSPRQLRKGWIAGPRPRARPPALLPLRSPRARAPCLPCGAARAAPAPCPSLPRAALPGRAPRAGTARLHLCGLGAAGIGRAAVPTARRWHPSGGTVAAAGGGGWGKSRPAAGRGRRRQSHADKGRGEPRFVWLPARRARRRSAFPHWRREAPQPCPEGRPAPAPRPARPARAAGRRQSSAEGNGSSLQALPGAAAPDGPRGGGRRWKALEAARAGAGPQLQRRNSTAPPQERGLCPGATLGAHPRWGFNFLLMAPVECGSARTALSEAGSGLERSLLHTSESRFLARRAYTPHTRNLETNLLISARPVCPDNDSKTEAGRHILYYSLPQRQLSHKLSSACCP